MMRVNPMVIGRPIFGRGTKSIGMRGISVFGCAKLIKKEEYYEIKH